MLGFKTAFPMVSKIFVFVFHILFSLQLHPSQAQSWIRAGYYSCSDYDHYPIWNINSSLFTHLICAFDGVNSTSYQLSVSPSDETCFSTFADTMKQKNPSISMLLSISDEENNYLTFSSMASNPSHRKSFIDSSIKIARLYGFQGLDLSWVYPQTRSDMVNLGLLFHEWKAAIRLEATNSSHSQLILTAKVHYSPSIFSWTYPIDLIQQNLNWVHVYSTDYRTPRSYNFTGPYAALYGASGDHINTDDGVSHWINGGLSASKLVLLLPYYGFAWTLENPMENGTGAPAKGPAPNNSTGFMIYKDIKKHISQYGPNVDVKYNATFVFNYWTNGTTWIGFDDVEAVKAKVSYVKKKKLLGYYAWLVSYDVNSVLSQAAAQESEIVSSSPGDRKNGQSKKRFLVIVLTTTAAVILLIGFVIYYFWIRNLKLHAEPARASKNKADKAAAIGELNSNVPNLREYTLAETEAATNGFSIENKLGEGGFGPVYKGILPDGQEIAVKKLSKSSTQGFEEFKNEVMLTAKLLHVNLVRVLGFCVDREEQMLIYEYMPNKSLDYYLFDPIKCFILDWRKRVHIIEGITQGLLYLQEYSRLIIIHRDLKASNVLLDKDMKPKISDFGMARIFAKTDQIEANTKKIVGTYGYVPPEYVKRGIYSIKSDVYSFGVLLLQIISGKKVSCFYGVNENLTLLEHAYELWKDEKGVEFMDYSLDDTDSSSKLLRCLQIALLCVQENPNDRPSMIEVSSMLKNEITDIKIPKKPAFSNQGKDEQNKSTSQCSVNDVTISEVVAR